METQEQRPIQGLYVKLDAEAHMALKLRSVREKTTISDLVRKALERCYGVAA